MPPHGRVRPCSAFSGSQAFNAFMLINVLMVWLTLKDHRKSTSFAVNNSEVALALQRRCLETMNTPGSSEARRSLGQQPSTPLDWSTQSRPTDVPSTSWCTRCTTSRPRRLGNMTSRRTATTLVRVSPQIRIRVGVMEPRSWKSWPAKKCHSQRQQKVKMQADNLKGQLDNFAGSPRRLAKKDGTNSKAPDGSESRKISRRCQNDQARLHRWYLFEDLVNWQNLHQEPRVEPNLRCVSLYRARLDVRQDRSFSNFPGMRAVTLQQMIRRAHEGVGYPEHSRFIRIPQLSRESDEVLEAARAFRCSTCAAYKIPEAARRGAPPREELFINEWVGVDTVHLHDHQNQATPALNIIDFNMHFQLVIPLDSESSSDIRKAYRQWFRYFGAPKKVFFDLGTEFKSVFRQQLQQDGSEALPSSLESPTQRGVTERAGGVYKNILYRAMMDYKCHRTEEWLELVDIAVMTKSRLLFRAGYSPIQRVIGFSPRLPGGLLSGGESDHVVSDMFRVGDRDVARAMRMRHAAAVAFHAADCDQALRAAALPRPRKLADFEAGQSVFFWRRGAGSAKKTRQSYWHRPARVMMTSLQNAVWVSCNETIVKAAPERLRHATEEENLSVSGWLGGCQRLDKRLNGFPTRGSWTSLGTAMRSQGTKEKKKNKKTMQNFLILKHPKEFLIRPLYVEFGRRHNGILGTTPYYANKIPNPYLYHHLLA